MARYRETGAILNANLDLAAPRVVCLGSGRHETAARVAEFGDKGLR